MKRGYLGVRSQPVDIPKSQQESLDRPQGTGLLLVGVEEGSPAEAGGLMVGDLIVGFAGAPLSEPDELLTRLTGEVVGKPTPVEVLRGGQLQEITVTIGDRK